MFADEWENFMFAENFFGKPECLICQRSLPSNRTLNIKRHFNRCHQEYVNISSEEKNALILELHKSFYEKMIMDFEESKITTNERSLKRKAFYVVAVGLAKHCRPLEDGQFFKELSNNVLKCFGTKYDDIRKIINEVPLSRTTITRRTEEISAFIYSNIRSKILNCKYFSIGLDECTDINNIAQLIICVRTVDSDFKIHEEMLSMVGLHGNVYGKTIFDVVNEELFLFADKNKFSSVCTDGANVMVGKKDGFVGYLLKHHSEIYSFHCIIHQQALFTKSLNLINTMQISTKIVNKIRGGHNALTHRKFKTFLEEINAEYGDLLMYTEVRWLSKGRCLQRLYSLREDVALFFETNPSNETNELLAHLKDKKFLLDFAFLTDVTESVNQLNLQLQGLQCYVCEDCNEYQDFTELIICGEVAVDSVQRPTSETPTHVTSISTITQKPSASAGTDDYNYEYSMEDGSGGVSSQIDRNKTTNYSWSTTTNVVATTIIYGGNTITSTTSYNMKPMPPKPDDYDYLEYEDTKSVHLEQQTNSLKGSLLKTDKPVCFMYRYKVNNTILTDRGCTTLINNSKVLTCQLFHNGASMIGCRVCFADGCNRFEQDESDEDHLIGTGAMIKSQLFMFVLTGIIFLIMD